MELCTAHARKQFETYAAQAKELAELSQKVASENRRTDQGNRVEIYKPAA